MIRLITFIAWHRNSSIDLESFMFKLSKLILRICNLTTFTYIVPWEAVSKISHALLDLVAAATLWKIDSSNAYWIKSMGFVFFSYYLWAVLLSLRQSLVGCLILGYKILWTKQGLHFDSPKSIVLTCEYRNLKLRCCCSSPCLQTNNLIRGNCFLGMGVCAPLVDFSRIR